MVANFSPIDGFHTGKILSFHINLRITNIDAIDGSHAGDFARIESDAINFRAKRCVIGNFCGLLIQVSYFFHQSVGMITNRGFKVPYASNQCCNHSLICLIVQRIIDIRLIRLLCHICRHSLLDFSFPVISQIAQVSICFVTQRRCNCGCISFAIHSIFKSIQRVICSKLTFRICLGIHIRRLCIFPERSLIRLIVFQFGDVICILGDVRCICSNLLPLLCYFLSKTASRIPYIFLQFCNIRFICGNISSKTFFFKRIVHFFLRVNLHSTSGTALIKNLESGTRYTQSPAEERKRHKRREKGTSSHPPNFFRAGSRLGMRPSDFRRYHIAILCLGPDDFVDVVHDDFPLCEKQ